MSTTRTTPLRERMRQDLQIAGLSARTQQAYLREVRKLASHLRCSPDQITETQLREYFLYLKNETPLAPASIKMAFHGIRFFFRHTEPRPWQTLEAGVNLRLIQQYLGHSSLQTTTLYLHLTSHGQEHAIATIERLMQ